MPIDVKRAMAIIRDAERHALEELGDIVVKSAKQRAPTRKLDRAKGRRKYRTIGLNSPEGRMMMRAYSKIAKGPTDIFVAQEKQRLLGQAPGFRVKVVRKGTVNRPLKVGRIPYVEPNSRGVAMKNILGKNLTETFRSRRGLSATQRRDFRRVGKNQTGFNLSDDAMDQLSPQGRYEVRSGRAISLETINQRVDGKLVQVATSIQIGGTLRKSIVHSGAQRSKRGMKINIGTDVPYARYVEFPTSHNGAQPFLLPALKDAKKVARRVFEGALKVRGLKRG